MQSIAKRCTIVRVPSSWQDSPDLHQRSLPHVVRQRRDVPPCSACPMKGLAHQARVHAGARAQCASLPKNHSQINRLQESSAVATMQQGQRTIMLLAAVGCTQAHKLHLKSGSWYAHQRLFLFFDKSSHGRPCSKESSCCRIKGVCGLPGLDPAAQCHLHCCERCCSAMHCSALLW